VKESERKAKEKEGKKERKKNKGGRKAKQNTFLTPTWCKGAPNTPNYSQTPLN